MGFRRWLPRILWEAGSTAAGGRVGERRHGARSVQEFGWGKSEKTFACGQAAMTCYATPVRFLPRGHPMLVSTVGAPPI
jgi:hypothetical protein